jgi:hypothetical protein
MACAKRRHAGRRQPRPTCIGDCTCELIEARLIAPDAHPPHRKRREVYCHFDDDVKARAPFDAQRLMNR